VAQVKEQYLAHFADLVRTQKVWNHDYEQYVVAYKPNLAMNPLNDTN
jgi:hypothetical protein